MAFPKPPGPLAEIAKHLRPVLSTDDSHDIPNATATHDAELDREAAEGMVHLPPPTGPTESEQRAADGLDASIAAARAATGLDGGVPIGPRAGAPLGPRADAPIGPRASAAGDPSDDEAPPPPSPDEVDAVS